MTNCAACNTTKDISATCIAWNHTIHHNKATSANVISNDFERWASWIAILTTSCVNSFFSCFEQIHKEVNLIVRVNVLQHCRNTLKTHTSIYTRLGQWMHIARFIAIELHEYVIPDLNVAIAVFIRTTWRAASNMWTMVIEDFSTGAAWTCVTHHPEVI